MSRLIVFVLVGDARTRPDKTHVTAENIQELGKLIEASGSEQRAQRYQTRIPMRIEFNHWPIGFDQLSRVEPVSVSFGIYEHRAEFEAGKLGAFVTDARLPEENRAWRT